MIYCAWIFDEDNGVGNRARNFFVVLLKKYREFEFPKFSSSERRCGALNGDCFEQRCGAGNNLK